MQTMTLYFIGFLLRNTKYVFSLRMQDTKMTNDTYSQPSFGVGSSFSLAAPPRHSLLPSLPPSLPPSCSRSIHAAVSSCRAMLSRPRACVPLNSEFRPITPYTFIRSARLMTARARPPARSPDCVRPSFRSPSHHFATLRTTSRRV